MIFEYFGPDWISHLPVVSIFSAGGKMYQAIEEEPGACLVVIPNAVATLAPGWGLGEENGKLRWHVRLLYHPGGMQGFSFDQDHVDMLYAGVDNLLPYPVE